MNQSSEIIMGNEPITIKSLIKQGNTILQGIKYVPAPEGILRTFAVYSLADELQYERWKNITLRFLSSEFSNDISVDEFKKASESFELHCHSPREMKKMIGILESFDAIPTHIDNTINQPDKQPSIIINNSQSQNQTIDISFFTKALEDVITVNQINELKKVVNDEGGDVTKAKNKLIEKLKSFGVDLTSNIVANIITNPSIFGKIFK